jgi:hypothetical protein
MVVSLHVMQVTLTLPAWRLMEGAVKGMPPFWLQHPHHCRTPLSCDHPNRYMTAWQHAVDGVQGTVDDSSRSSTGGAPSPAGSWQNPWLGVGQLVGHQCHY